MRSDIQTVSETQENGPVCRELILLFTEEDILPIEDRPVLSLTDFLEKMEFEEQQNVDEKICENVTNIV